MTAKDYLLQVRKADRLIDCKLEEIDKLRTMVTSVSGAWKDDVVKSSGSQDKLGDCIAKMIDLQNELNADIDRFVDLRREIMDVIDDLDAPFVEILYKRYFKYEKWEAIAIEMNYSFRQVTRLHGKALQRVGELLKNKNVSDNVL